MNRLIRWILPVLLIAPVLIGCEEDVMAVLGTDYPFTIWGVMNPEADTQFVRVFPIEGTLRAGDPEPLDAQFTSTDLETGEERVWLDSIRIGERNLVEHFYYLPIPAEYGHTYHLELVSGDGRTSSVEVDVPARTDLILSDVDTTGPVRLPVHIPNDPPNLIHTRVLLGMSYVVGYSASGCPDYRYVEHSLPFDDQRRPVEGGFSFVVNLNDIYSEVLSITRNDDAFIPQHGITLGFISFSTVVANRAWDPPDDTFDPSVLVQPGTMENVENGFGFVGAGFRLSRTWSLAPHIVERTGFRTDYDGCP